MLAAVFCVLCQSVLLKLPLMFLYCSYFHDSGTHQEPAMVRTRRQAAAALAFTAGHVIEHPVVWDYVGKDRYLQVAVSKSVAQLYAARFGALTSKKLTIIAAQSGCLELLRWARSIGCTWDDSVFLTACESNLINILEQLVAEGSLRPAGVIACKAAARKGHTIALQWLREHGFSWNKEVTGLAAAYGHLEALQFLFAEGCPWGEVICEHAVSSGDLNVLRWVHAQGCPLLLGSGYTAACQPGDIEMLRWLFENNAPLDEWTCALAAIYNNSEKLQFLRAQGIPWDYRTIEMARDHGHDELARWARENGCPEPPNYTDSSDEEEDN